MPWLRLYDLPYTCSLQQLEEKCANKTVVVLPAFQTAPQLGNESAGHELAARAAAVSSKANLRQLMEQQLVFQFHMTHYRQVGLVHTVQQRPNHVSDSGNHPWGPEVSLAGWQLATSNRLNTVTVIHDVWHLDSH